MSIKEIRKDNILRGGPGEVNSPALPSNSPPNPRYGGEACGPAAEAGADGSGRICEKKICRNPTLVFFHGWGASGQVWERQKEYFQDRLTILTPTIPVWEVGWFADYLRALPLGECVLVGWSLGGMLLLEALSRLPAPAPGGLVLVGVAPVFTRRPDYPLGQSPAVVRAMRRGLQKNRQQVLDEFLDRCLAPGEGAQTSPARAAFASSDTAGNLAAGLDYLLTHDLRPLLPGLSGGAIIIQGQEDRVVPPDQGKFLTAQLAGARLNLLPGAGHLPFFTQAAAFNGIVEECLITAS